eukprot:1271802-Pyramimonas_sp.AAC.1
MCNTRGDFLRDICVTGGDFLRDICVTRADAAAGFRGAGGVQRGHHCGCHLVATGINPNPVGVTLV